ncbi:hypothetical protein CUMW_020110 [Citrus unshiu]|nr:hypothetical protein CUMW_020110 [Citrus unshiu]
MARYRSRSYSPRRRSRSPRIRGRKRYDDEPRRSYGDRRSPAPSGLLVRNLPLDASGRYGGSSRRTPPRSPRRRYHCQTFWHDHVQVVGLHSSEALTPAHLHQCVSQDSKVKRGTFKDFRFIEIKERDHKVKQHAYLSIKASQYVLSIVSPSPAIQWNWISYCVTSVKKENKAYSWPKKEIIFKVESYSKFYRDRRARDDNRSPRQSRSISRSLSPRDERDYRSNERYPSPMENGRRSPHDERGYEPSMSRSPRGNSRSPSRSRSRSYRVELGLRFLFYKDERYSAFIYSYSLMDVEAFVPVGSCYAYNAVIRINKEIGQDQMKAK